MVEVLVTGGAGFIGSNFVRYALSQHQDWRVTTLDKLTYAGRRENLHDVMDHPRHTFVHGDIADAAVSGPLVEQSELVVHFAAETHVDRSILAAGDFIRTDVEGTFVLLEAARRAKSLRRFVQISTDEVYGSVATGASRETDELKPRNPYAASKAGADRLAYSYWATYNVPVVITRASNNYGPYQFPEKVIPLFVTNAIDDIPVPLYGDGRNVRDWLHVDDHCRAVDLLIDNGADGEVYNIGGGNDVMNVDLTKRILGSLGKPVSLIKPVPIAPGTTAATASTRRSCGRWAGPRRSPFEHGLARHRRLVPRATSGGGGRSRSRIPRSVPTTRRSTNVEREHRPSSENLKRERRRSRHRRGRLRGKPPARASRRHAPISRVGPAPSRQPKSRGSARWTRDRPAGRDHVRQEIADLKPAEVYHCAGARACGRLVAEHVACRSPATC